MKNKNYEEFDESKINDETLKKYESNYNEAGLFRKMAGSFQKIGLELMYKAAQLYYVMQKDEVPATVKATIMGALGYLISPLDFIPDFIPVIGYTDDAAAIAYALWVAQQYIDEDVKSKSKCLLAKWCGKSVYSKLD